MIDSRPVAVVVEDEPRIRAFVAAALVEDGCRVVETGTARDGLAAVDRAKPALVLLDLGLPDRDGVEFIRDLRRWSTAPVIVLSARSAEAEKIEALDAGADDYLTKPFGVGELLARVRVALRRHPAGRATDAATFDFGDVHVDHLQRVVLRSGERVHLTPIEYRLLSLFIAHAGRVLTHRQLLREIWGAGADTESTYLRVHVGHLRHKLEADPTRPRHIVTETGVGYRFVA
jgi:two-component system, OmpR family, KDP operon response regulator KdpE